jgi:hypothetical protein
MPLNNNEYNSLEKWSFVEAYKMWRTELVEIAKGVYVTVCHDYNDDTAPDLVQVEYHLHLALIQTNVWEDIIRAKEQTPDRRMRFDKQRRSHFANLMSKLVLEQDWAEVEQPCP